MPSNNSLNGFDAFESGFSLQESPEYASFQLEGDWESFDEDYPASETFSAENMTLGEIEKLLDHYQENYDDAEIAPLVAGLISAAPAIIQGVSGLVQSFSRPRQSAPPPPPPRSSAPPPSRSVPPTPRYRPAPPVMQTRPGFSPIRRPTYSPPAVNPLPPPVAPPTSGGGMDISTLLGLLQNSQILNAVQNLAPGGNPAGGDMPVGDTDVPISSVLNTIAQLAANIGGAVTQENTYYPEYYFDSVGNLLVDPASPENVGELILEKLNY